MPPKILVMIITAMIVAVPSLSFGQELVISYVVNSFDFWQVARQAELYWPRFVRVTLVTSN